MFRADDSGRTAGSALGALDLLSTRGSPIDAHGDLALTALYVRHGGRGATLATCARLSLYSNYDVISDNVKSEGWIS